MKPRLFVCFDCCLSMRGLCGFKRAAVLVRLHCVSAGVLAPPAISPSLLPSPPPSPGPATGPSCCPSWPWSACSWRPPSPSQHWWPRVGGLGPAATRLRPCTAGVAVGAETRLQLKDTFPAEQHSLLRSFGEQQRHATPCVRCVPQALAGKPPPAPSVTFPRASSMLTQHWWVVPSTCNIQ